MNNKKCGNCGNEYDESLNVCPFCNYKSEYNVKNMFLNSNEKNYNDTVSAVKERIADLSNIHKIDNKPIIDSKTEELNNSVNDQISNNNQKQKYSDEKLEKKLETINKRNASLKKNKKKEKNNFYSFFLLIIGMILLFIIVFSTINEFDIIPFCHYVSTVLLLMIAFSLSYRGKEIGYFLAVIASISMIFMINECDYISSIVGIYIFTSSFKYLIKK